MCISNCGACCRLDPAERSEALVVLSEEQRLRYLEMVGADGWCIHFDTGSRRCRIYESRPDFCRVDQLAHLFKVPLRDQNSFAIACCKAQIRVEYGGKSLESRRFDRAIRSKR
jgi:Fe-S-cluster containining protein